MGLVIDTMSDIGVTRVSRWTFNCYLIHDGGEGRPIVVDPGLPRVVDDLRGPLAALGRGLADVGGLIATHGHSDHVGGAPALSAQSGAGVCLPARTHAYLAGERPRTPSVPAIARIWPVAVDQPFDPRGAVDAARGARIAGYGTAAGMRWPEALVVGPLHDGQTVPGAPDWEVISSPGHTDDSISLFNRATRTLVSGDAILGVAGRAWITPETVDDEKGAATADRLRALDVDHVLPGHGRPVHGRRVVAAAWGPTEAPRSFASGCGAAARRLGLRRATTISAPQAD